MGPRLIAAGMRPLPPATLVRLPRKAVPTVSGTLNEFAFLRRNRSPITLSRPLAALPPPPSSSSFRRRDSRTLLTLESRDFRSLDRFAPADEPPGIRKHLHSRQLFSIKVLVNHYIRRSLVPFSLFLFLLHPLPE